MAIPLEARNSQTMMGQGLSIKHLIQMQLLGYFAHISKRDVPNELDLLEMVDEAEKNCQILCGKTLCPLYSWTVMRLPIRFSVVICSGIHESVMIDIVKHRMY